MWSTSPKFRCCRICSLIATVLCSTPRSQTLDRGVSWQFSSNGLLQCWVTQRISKRVSMLLVLSCRFRLSSDDCVTLTAAPILIIRHCANHGGMVALMSGKRIVVPKPLQPQKAHLGQHEQRCLPARTSIGLQWTPTLMRWLGAATTSQLPRTPWSLNCIPGRNRHLRGLEYMPTTLDHLTGSTAWWS